MSDSDHLWKMVFYKLNWADRLPLESVCKAWENVMPYDDVGIINVSTLPQLRVCEIRLVSLNVWRNPVRHRTYDSEQILALIRCLLLSRRMRKVKLRGFANICVGRHSSFDECPQQCAFLVNSPLLHCLSAYNVNLETFHFPCGGLLESRAIGLLKAMYPAITSLAFTEVVILQGTVMKFESFEDARQHACELLKSLVDVCKNLISLQLFDFVPVRLSPAMHELRLVSWFDCIPGDKTRPTQVVRCPNLRLLVYDSVFFNKDFGAMPQLRRLELRNCFPIERFVFQCTHSSKLTHLEFLYNSSLQGVGVVGSLLCLKVLKFTNCRLECLRTEIMELKTCTKIEQFSFKSSEVVHLGSECMFHLVANFPNVREFECTFQKRIDEAPMHDMFLRCANLERLVMQGSMFYFDFASMIAKAPAALTWLDVSLCDCLYNRADSSVPVTNVDDMQRCRPLTVCLGDIAEDNLLQQRLLLLEQSRFSSDCGTCINLGPSTSSAFEADV